MSDEKSSDAQKGNDSQLRRQTQAMIAGFTHTMCSCCGPSARSPTSLPRVDHLRSDASSSLAMQGVELPGVGNAFEFVDATFFKLEACADHEVLDPARYKNFAIGCERGHLAAILTAIPVMSSSMNSTSPMCAQERTSKPRP
jgi:hypothetical protein